MKIHKLKCNPVSFSAIYNGFKTNEVRFNDRGYEEGDYLLLEETKYNDREMQNGKLLSYTGQCILARITCLEVDYGLKEDWVALSLKILDKTP